MPEKTKREKADENSEAEKPPREKKEIGDETDWSKDQEEKSYYYDDAHGYEIYNPDEDDDE